jgi:hypothetical protein
MKIVRNLNIDDILHENIEGSKSTYNKFVSLLDNLRPHNYDGSHFFIDSSNYIQFEIDSRNRKIYINEILWAKIHHILIRYYSHEIPYVVKAILNKKYDIDSNLYLIEHKFRPKQIL